MTATKLFYATILSANCEHATDAVKPQRRSTPPVTQVCRQTTAAYAMSFLHRGQAWNTHLCPHQRVSTPGPPARHVPATAPQHLQPGTRYQQRSNENHSHLRAKLNTERHAASQQVMSEH